MKARLVFLLLVLFIHNPATGQSTTTDNDDNKLKLAGTDAEKLNLYLQQSQDFFASDPLLALEYGQKARELAEKLGNDSLVAVADHYRANALLHLGNYPQALDLYLSMLSYGERKQDSTILVIAYGNIGNVYYYQHDYEDALKYDTLALLHFRKTLTDSRQLLRKANLMSNVGTIYDETKKFKEAGAYYQQALQIATQLNNDETIANILNNTGTLYRDQGDLQSALQYYRKAFAIRQKNNNQLGIARSCFSIGLFHYEHGSMDSAAYYLSKSIESGQKIGALQTVSAAAEYYYRANKTLKDYPKAIDALELFNQVNDSLFNEQTTKRIAQLEMQFQFDKKQNEMKAEQKERELYYLLGATLLLLLLLLATSLFLFQRSKTKEAKLKQAHTQLEKLQLKSDLDKKDKELATNVTFLLSKNELINSISEKLLEIKQSMPAESRSALQKVILDIQSNLQPELWQEFEYRFQQVYENFYKVLTVKFPDLTPSERRLCAFLKLNMTTKEISALTHQNAKSIDVARTRLRKKLGLTGLDQNLVLFLDQLDSESNTTALSAPLI